MRVRPGLCGSCAHARVIESRNGSRFYYCRRSQEDARYPRYPPLPVLECAGYDAIDRDGGGGRAAAGEEPQ